MNAAASEKMIERATGGSDWRKRLERANGTRRSEGMKRQRLNDVGIDFWPISVDGFMFWEYYIKGVNANTYCIHHSCIRIILHLSSRT